MSLFDPRVGYYPANYMPSYATNASTINVWATSASTLWPSSLQIASEWQQAKTKADIKAEPEDEFSWLRRRVREVEELAFA